SVLVRGAHHERIERAHFLVEQAGRIVLGIVAAKAVRANHLGETVGLVRRGGVSAAAHFGETNAKSRLGQLPGSLGSGQAATDDVHVEGHAGLLVPASRAIQRPCTSSRSAMKARRWTRFSPR